MIDPNNPDFRLWEQELHEDLPYGADMLVNLTPEAAIGVLACINGNMSSVTDESQPYPPGSGAIDDQNNGLFMPAPNEDVASLS
jgi:hypothetical protein